MFNFRQFFESFDNCGWIIDGKIYDLSDTEVHSRIALYAIRKEIINKFINSSQFEMDNGYVRWEQFKEWLMKWKKNNNFRDILKREGIDDKLIRASFNEYGPEEYAIRYYKWILFRNKNIDLFDYNENKYKLYKILKEKFSDNTELNIFDYKNDKSFTVVLKDMIESNRLPSIPDSKGHKDYFIIPNDGENMRIPNV